MPFYENTDLPTHPGQFPVIMFPSSSWDMAIGDQHDRRVIALSPKCVLTVYIKDPCQIRGVGGGKLSDMLDQRASNPSRYRMTHTAAGEREKMRISTQHGIKMDTLLFQSA